MITVSQLSKRYGKHVVVDDMTFDVAAGRVTGFVGPNGAGKSTTMRMMVGLTRPDHGDVRYRGVRYTDLQHPARVVGSVLDARCMHPGRTARHHLHAIAQLSGIPPRRVGEVLHEVGLDAAADQRAGGFSLGKPSPLPSHECKTPCCSAATPSPHSPSEPCSSTDATRTDPRAVVSTGVSVTRLHD